MLAAMRRASSHSSANELFVAGEKPGRHLLQSSYCSHKVAEAFGSESRGTNAGPSGKPPSADVTTTSSAPNARPEDRAERRQVTVMFSAKWR